MRRRRIWPWLLAIGVALGTVTFAQADDDSPARPTGNWFTRLFHRQPAAPRTEAARPTPSKGESPAVVRVQAQMELLRRQEVCNKLREVAIQNRDDELERKADQLDQRAWDAYVARMSRIPGARNALTPDDQVMQNGLGLGTSQPSALNPAASSRRPAQGGQAALRGK